LGKSYADMAEWLIDNNTFTANDLMLCFEFESICYNPSLFNKLLLVSKFKNHCHVYNNFRYVAIISNENMSKIDQNKYVESLKLITKHTDFQNESFMLAIIQQSLRLFNLVALNAISEENEYQQFLKTKYVTIYGNVIYDALCGDHIEFVEYLFTKFKCQILMEGEKIPILNKVIRKNDAKLLRFFLSLSVYKNINFSNHIDEISSSEIMDILLDHIAY
jgi:hypothetical protein